MTKHNKIFEKYKYTNIHKSDLNYNNFIIILNSVSKEILQYYISEISTCCINKYYLSPHFIPP